MPWVGTIAPGWYADIVLLSDVEKFEIAKVWADGQQASEGKTYLPAEALHVEMQALYSEGEKVDWMYEPSFQPRWYPGFPERLAWATLTCAPWRWVLVAPSDYAPQGLVNVQTGAIHPVVF